MLVEHRGSFSSPHQKPKNQEEGGRGVIRVQTGEVDVSITKLPGPGSRFQGVVFVSRCCWSRDLT